LSQSSPIHTTLSCLSDILLNIVMIQGCDYRRGTVWWTELFTTYAHHSELQIIATLISTLYKSLYAKSSASYSVFTSRFLARTSNNGDSSPSRDHVLPSQSPIENTTLN
jgi:hypothetical protein